jgi:hypothetical protein
MQHTHSLSHAHMSTHSKTATATWRRRISKRRLRSRNCGSALTPVPSMPVRKRSSGLCATSGAHSFSAMMAGKSKKAVSPRASFSARSACIACCCWVCAVSVCVQAVCDDWQGGARGDLQRLAGPCHVIFLWRLVVRDLPLAGGPGNRPGFFCCIVYTFCDTFAVFVLLRALCRAALRSR